MSASSLVINLAEDSFNSAPQPNESEMESSLIKSTDNLQEDDIDLPQCKIKRNYACSHCSYYTQNPRFYLYHLKNVHKEKIRIYECPSCLYASKHSQKLQRHVHMVHVMCTGKRKVPAKPKPKPPPKPPKPAPPKVIRPAPKEEPEEESFVGGLIADGENESRNFKCSLCPFTSRSQTLVTRHERIVHLKKKFFRCIKCNYMTHMKARFTKHVKYHSMPMIKCDMCDFRTPYKWNLDRHNKNHMGDGAFKCSLCNFTADIKQSLTVHEMNHHVPPVGQATPTKRRNRVGASDTASALDDETIDHDELELLRLEREDEVSDDEMPQIKDTGIESLNHLDELEVTTKPLPPSSQPKKTMMKKPKAVAHFNTKELTVKLGEKVVNPGDVLQHKNGAVYVKKIKCRVCNYRAAWESEMNRHELRVHGLTEKKKAPARPIPNLIPIQNKSPSHPATPPSLSIPPPPLKSPQQKPSQMHNPPPPPALKIHSRPPSHPQILLQTPQSLMIQGSPQQLILQPQHPLQPLMLQSHQGQPFHQTPPPLRPSLVQPASPQQQAPILKIPTPVKGKISTQVIAPEKAMSEKDLNDICAKSCPNSSLKDFASLIGGDDAFKTSEENVAFSVGSGTSAFPIEKKEKKTESVEIAAEIKKTPDAFKKKNASFFDKLKEKLMTGAGESCNLVCDVCGHESKCLSESVKHQKMHNTKVSSNSSCNGNAVISGAELSSTRCQHCRQRCKTSSDLVVHLQSCAEAKKKSPVHVIDDDDEEEEEEEDDEERIDFDDDLKSEEGISDNEMEKPPHPMENKVFVWNNMSNCEEDAMHDEEDSRSKSPTSESSVVGIETAPGIGAVTSKCKTSSVSNSNGQNSQKSKSESVKKVYKCPHCSFWASTASRFHVHIVGHLNKKPFECSLCSYRSNWRWDITKHIRLKTVRDSTHERARVLMTDETGRRNYSKYNKYLTLMRVHEPTAESSGSGRRTKPLTQSYDPIETLPAPPKLTPAPLSALQSNSPNNVMIMNSSTPPPPPPLSQRPLYSKPPPLQSSLDMKRSAQESDLEPPKKKLNVENKKTMWKCKKCLFRDSDRAVVLAHVKEHYRSQSQTTPGGAPSSELTDEAQEASALGDDAPFMCGHCHQVSNWKHVIQRHCRLKHCGDVKVIVGQPRQGVNIDESFQDECMDDGENDQGNDFMCETCPFVCSNQKELDEHMECHFERPGASFKCYYCPYYVKSKPELLEHISLHGDSDGDDNSQRNFAVQQGRTSLENGENSSSSKRYRCSICPYVSNSKSQFLYHKQFHRPRNAPFKCTMCSYNVTRRHLLHQHLRLHGINVLIPKTKDFGYNEFEEGVDLVGTMNELDTSKMSEIPLVWVSKMGNLTKMFKCRYCPHVNIRKSNIQEHEKMHGIRIKNNNPDGSPPHPQQQHHCPDCNYICNNAGVLSSHAKVHQGLFGQVCSLVDMSRPDDVQIKELNAILGRHEEGPPEILPDEINKDFKDSSPAPVVQINERDTEQLNTDGKVLHFCSTCPARFLYPKELEIHTRFHNLQLQFRCEHCTYTARQQPHLLAHYKVHTDEYQDRTSSLCDVYRISNQNPKPKIAVVVDGSESAGNAWVVVPMQKMVHTNNHTNEYELDETFNDISLHGSRVIHKQFACDKCPAKFFKTVALQYHMTLHGGPGPHKCRVCDYSVKTYGNLIKHEAVHEELEPRAKVKAKTKRVSENVPTSGTELFRQKTEAAQKCAANPPLPPPPPPPLHIDPEFGILMHGSPEFIYPTYLKNGRLKEKRYKCHKCPSAFEKREQYKVHLSLHGSKQRYKCERCDYSVKLYANYIQHLRKHQSNDATKAERTVLGEGKGEDSGTEVSAETTDNSVFQSNEDLTNIVMSRSAKKMQLSMADQQTMMLMQQRVVSNSVSTPEILNRCPHCPYSNQRKDGVGSHARCHSNAKGGAFTCKHCDYTVPQQHFLREHNKLHFSPMKGNRPEAFMKCDRLELWAEPIEQTNEPVNKILIFKDKGANFKVKRFLPEVSEDVVTNGDFDIKERTYVNLKSGELESGQESPPESPEKDDNKENKDTVCNGSAGEEEAMDENPQEESSVNDEEDENVANDKTEENFSDSETDKNSETKNVTDNESNHDSEEKVVNEEETSINGDDKSLSSDGKNVNDCETKSTSGEENKETECKYDNEQHVMNTSSDSDSEDSSSDSSSSDESDGDSSSSSVATTQQD